MHTPKEDKFFVRKKVKNNKEESYVLYCYKDTISLT